MEKNSNLNVKKQVKETEQLTTEEKRNSSVNIRKLGNYSDYILTNTGLDIKYIKKRRKKKQTTTIKNKQKFLELEICFLKIYKGNHTVQINYLF